MPELVRYSDLTVDFRTRVRASASFLRSTWRTIATLVVLVGLVLTVPRSWRVKPAQRPDVVGAPTAEVLPAGAYAWPPSVGSLPQPDGRHLTVVRFIKLDGPWNGQESKFDLWFDGDVEPEFDSRGFESPMSFNVQVPEPRHFSISVATPPLLAAKYVVFSFSSAKAVALVRSQVSPKGTDDGGR